MCTVFLISKFQPKFCGLNSMKDHFLMENPWLSVDIEESSEESSDSYYGVFTRSPLEIARTLPRPVNPGCHQTFSMKHIPQYDDSDYAYNESPTSSNFSPFRFSETYVSVF